MLILMRKVGEKLIIGGNIEIFVSGAKGNQVRLGVNAPKEVSVQIEEFYLRIHKEKSNEKKMP